MGNFDYQNSKMSFDDFEELNKKWQKIRAAHELMIDGRELSQTINGKTVKLFTTAVNGNMEAAFEAAKEDGVVGGTLDEVSQQYVAKAASSAGALKDVAKSEVNDTIKKSLDEDPGKVGKKIANAKQAKAFMN